MLDGTFFLALGRRMLLFWIVALVGVLSGQGVAKAPLARTSGGVLVGNSLPGVNEFLGIPFGKPTRRFEPPEDWSGPYASNPFEANDFGPACLQVGNTPKDVYGSEDCLFANVWQPANATVGAELPVIVFIYGGSNQFGETEPYNGSAMAARQGVVYVSIAYRTGPLGWMAFKEDKAAGRPTGTYGMLDTQSGLRWVQREIASFGGSPDKVVIHGQSSGAGLVELHLVMPGSNGLLMGLVSESGGLTASELREGFLTSRGIGKLAGCSEGHGLKACLQQAPAVALTSQTYSWGFGPHVDGIVIPASPMEMLREGRINPVSVIMGAQTNDTFREMSPKYTGPDGKLIPLSVDAYEKQVAAEVGESLLKRALSLYPPNPVDLVENVHRLSSLSSDRSLCSIRQRVSLVNKFRPGRAWMYRFNWWYQSNPRCTAEPNYHAAELGAMHEDEVTFVMGQPIFMFKGSCCGKWGAKLEREPCAQAPECVSCWDPSLGDGYHAYFNDKEWSFSQMVGGFWANFARTGSPNGRLHRQDWPTFSDGSEVTQNIVLDADVPRQHVTENTLYDNAAICEFWDDFRGRAPLYM